MVDAWSFAGEPASDAHEPGTTTLLDGTTFCISNSIGDVEPGASHGLFVADTRFVSCWRLRLDGVAGGALSFIEGAPSGGSFVSRMRPSLAVPDPVLLVVRDRHVGEGMSELVTLRNLGRDRLALRIEFEVAADFAHLFEVKEERVQPRGFRSVEIADDEMRFDFRDGGRERLLRLSVPKDAEAGPGRIAFNLNLGPGESFSRSFEFTVRVDDVDLPPRHHGGTPGGSESAAGYETWMERVPHFVSSHEGLTSALARSVADLGALRIRDELLDDEAVIAAGAPWYMAMFGRDSLIASEMSLLLDPSMALGTLRALARHQGDHEDDETEEQPGKILHEMRFRIDGAAGGPSRSAYYGSIDSTPLFVCLLGEAARFGIPDDAVDALLPAADRAIEWIDRYGDLDGDGFVEYRRRSSAGLVNQGWKDSPDGINFADGTIATAPITLCEVQGYVYAALRWRAELGERRGEHERAGALRSRAQALQLAFEESFFIEERGYYAIALDGDKRRVDSLSSNIGHLLWSGIVSSERARLLADRLISDELFSGWGIRTLSSEMGAYNPMSYHNGSVWPHDTAIAVAGLCRYGFFEEASRIALGLIDAASSFAGRLPELFCGFSRHEFAAPVSYPAACAPQAWASASLVSMVRSLLGFEPDLRRGTLHLTPALDDRLGSIEIDGIGLAGSSVNIRVSPDGTEIGGLSDLVDVSIESRLSATS